MAQYPIFIPFPTKEEKEKAQNMLANIKNKTGDNYCSIFFKAIESYYGEIKGMNVKSVREDVYEVYD